MRLVVSFSVLVLFVLVSCQEQRYDQPISVASKSVLQAENFSSIKKEEQSVLDDMGNLNPDLKNKMIQQSSAPSLSKTNLTPISLNSKQNEEILASSNKQKQKSSDSDVQIDSNNAVEIETKADLKSKSDSIAKKRSANDLNGIKVQKSEIQGEIFTDLDISNVQDESQPSNLISSTLFDTNAESANDQDDRQPIDSLSSGKLKNDDVISTGSILKNVQEELKPSNLMSSSLFDTNAESANDQDDRQPFEALSSGKLKNDNANIDESQIEANLDWSANIFDSNLKSDSTIEVRNALEEIELNPKFKEILLSTVTSSSDDDEESLKINDFDSSNSKVVEKASNSNDNIATVASASADQLRESFMDELVLEISSDESKRTSVEKSKEILETDDNQMSPTTTTTSTGSSANESSSEKENANAKSEEDHQFVIDTTDYRPNDESHSLKSQIMSDNRFGSKYCADLEPLRNLFLNHLEPRYIYPLINTLPESMHLTFMDQTSFVGLSTASCVILFMIVIFFMSSWFLVASRRKRIQLFHMNELNNKCLALNNLLKKCILEKEIIENTYLENELKYAKSEEMLAKKDDQLRMLQIEHSQKVNAASLSAKEFEKLKSTELKLQNELTNTKLELNQIIEQLEQAKRDNEKHVASIEEEATRRLNEVINERDQCQIELDEHKNYVRIQNEELDQLRSSDIELRDKLEERERTIEMLQNCLLNEKNLNSTSANGFGHDEIQEANLSEGRLNGANESNESDGREEQRSVLIDDLMRTAELKMKIKELESELDAEKANVETRRIECERLQSKIAEHDGEMDKLREKQKELTKQLKDQEMQVKLLNELREKDTKQHVKSLADLDAQLKKKTSDADKVIHLLDQLRVKQERIQELESQFARIEKQSTTERQTFEKQAHENWLSARKFEKELKEVSNEAQILRDRLAELEKSKLNDNCLIRPIVNGDTRAFTAFMSPSQLQQQQIIAQQARKSIDDSSRVNISNLPDEEQASSLAAVSVNANASIGENKLENDGAQPLQVETDSQLDMEQQIGSQMRSHSSNSGLTIYPPQAMYANPFARTMPFKMPFSNGFDQRSSLDGIPNGAPPFPRMPVAYPPQVMYRMYQQQQYMQQQQQQKSYSDLNTSQTSSPRPASANQSQLLPTNNCDLSGSHLLEQSFE